MKSAKALALLMALSLTQNTVFADITDLPNPDDSSFVVPERSRVDELSSSVSIPSVSRRTGGATYKVKLARSLSLSHIEVRVTKNQAKLFKAILVLDDGTSVSASFQGQDVLTAGSRIVFENMNQSNRVASIEVTAESFGAEAELQLIAIGDREAPRMVIQVAAPAVKPVPKPKPKPPVVNVDEGSEIRVGSEILYASSYPGVVKEVFKEKILIALHGGGSNMLVTYSSVAKAVNELKGFYRGREVLYSQSYRGTVTRVYSNSLAAVRLAGNSEDSVIRLSDLQYPVKCNGDICPDRLVLYGGSYLGRVKNVFSGGTVEVLISGNDSTSIVNVRNLSPRVKCSRGFCEGQRVIYSNSYVGTIRSVFKNEYAAVVLDGNADPNIVRLHSLSH